MKAKDLLEHFLSRADWVDRSNTVDRIIAGNPDKEVEQIGGLEAEHLPHGSTFRLVGGG